MKIELQNKHNVCFPYEYSFQYLKIQFLRHRKQIYFPQQTARDQFWKWKRQLLQRFSVKSGGTGFVNFTVEC